MPVDLPNPDIATPPEVLAPRRRSQQIRVGKVLVGGDAPVSVQSMTTTQTTDINSTLQQIAQLTALHDSIAVLRDAAADLAPDSCDPDLVCRYL